MANTKLYIHEFIDIIGHNRANYMHHMTANWSPIAQRERGQQCYGVWGTVGSTLRWPEVVNLWEEDGWAGMASSFRHEFNHPTLQDPALSAWWSEAAKFRRSGRDRLLEPAPWTRTIAELNADGARGETYAHEVVQVPAGRSWDFLETVREQAVPVFQPYGWELIGAWSTAMVHESECLLLWAIPSWEQWAEAEARQRADANLVDWRRRADATAKEWLRFLLVDAPLSPLRTGRQPTEDDRASYQLPT
jgi:hypothetical protein